MINIKDELQLNDVSKNGDYLEVYFGDTIDFRGFNGETETHISVSKEDAGKLGGRLLNIWHSADERPVVPEGEEWVSIMYWHPEIPYPIEEQRMREEERIALGGVESEPYPGARWCYTSDLLKQAEVV